MPNRGLYINQVYLRNVLDERPDKSKAGYRQNYIWRKLFPWKEFGTRELLVRRAFTSNQLATIYGPEGQPLPAPRAGFEQMLVTLMDIKAFDIVDPNIVLQDSNLAEGPVTTTNRTVSEIQAKVRGEVDFIMRKNEDRVDSTLELVAIGALLNNFVWPPVDDAGAAITPAPEYWETDIGETTWKFGLPSDLEQNITGLIDWEGSAATVDQRKVWSDATADIIGALDVMDQICVQKYGFSLKQGTIYCRDTLLTDIIKNTAILNLLRGDDNTQDGARNTILPSFLRRWFSEQLGYTFESYDTAWTYESSGSKTTNATNTLVHYLPKNKIIIVPPSGIEGVMGTAPVEHMDGSWKSGLMPWLYRDPRPPHRREAGVHVTAWPVFDYLQWATLQVLA